MNFNQPPQIKEDLERLAPLFMSTAVECLEAMLQVKPTIPTPWVVVERLSAPFDPLLTLGTANDAFQGMLIVGVAPEQLSALLGCECSEEEGYDALGEIGNTYAGMLMDVDAIQGVFGSLKQTQPMLMHGQTLFPRAFGLLGDIKVGSTTALIGYALRKLTV
jgi:hypothetical protein